MSSPRSDDGVHPPSNVLDVVVSVQELDRRRRQHANRMEQQEYDDIHGVPLRSCVILALYNFKGGVGKSTTALNVAAMLAEQGRRVLVVDCDPQCNTTSFYLPSATDEEDEEDEHTNLYSTCQAEDSDDDHELPDDPVKPPNKKDHFDLNALDHGIFKEDAIPDIWETLSPVRRGRTFDLQPPSRYFKPNSLIHGDNLLLIPGSPHIAEYESVMSGNTGAVKCAVDGAFGMVLRSAAHVTESDIVIVDLGPCVSRLNQVLIASCDYILPPVVADYFSLSSIHVLLSNQLVQFMKTHRKILEEEKKQGDDFKELKAMGFGFNAQFPRIFPFLVGNYMAPKRRANRTSERQMIGVVYSKYVHAMRDCLHSSNRIPPAISALFVADKERMVVCFCKNVSLIPMSQRWGILAVSFTHRNFRTQLLSSG